jgi:hypothetical protein
MCKNAQTLVADILADNEPSSKLAPSIRCGCILSRDDRRPVAIDFPQQILAVPIQSVPMRRFPDYTA